MKLSAVIHFCFVLIIGAVLWELLAWVILPDTHTHIDLYYREATAFTEKHGMSHIEYAEQTRYDLDRVMAELGMRPEPPQKDENEGSTTPGQ